MSLAAHLLERIATTGPLSVAEYMAECLLHPSYGYYTTRDPFGAAGDFTTAPEISQMFGELIGLCLAQSWLDQGAPSPFTLAELGPGRGTLMADLLRATRAVPGFHQGARITLCEASPTLRKRQQQAIAPHECSWIDSADQLPEGPLFLVANEFFDALPIRQFIRDGSGWRERMIGAEGEVLQFGLAQRQAQPALDYRQGDTKDGDMLESAPAAPAIITALAERIANSGGAALIIDYGDWRSLGDTLQALQNHNVSDPLADPGNADLTAHVDFEALALAASCKHTRLTPQGVFLERLGLTARANALANSKPADQQNAVIAAHRRLTHPEEMGTLFKVLGLYPPDAPPPPGLEP